MPSQTSPLPRRPSPPPTPSFPPFAAPSVGQRLLSFFPSFSQRTPASSKSPLSPSLLSPATPPRVGPGAGSSPPAPQTAELAAAVRRFQEEQQRTKKEKEQLQQLREEQRLAELQRAKKVEEEERQRAERQRRQSEEQQRQMLHRSPPRPATPSAPPPTLPSASSSPSSAVNGAAQPSPSVSPPPSSRERGASNALGGLREALRRAAATSRAAAVFLLRLLGLLGLLLLLLVLSQQPLVQRLLGWDHPTLFCPTSPSEGRQGESATGAVACTPCPPNGFCDDGGVLHCERTYIRQGELCVKDSDFLRGAMAYRTRAMDRLQQQAGLFECQQADTRRSPTHTQHRLLTPLDQPLRVNSCAADVC